MYSGPGAGGAATASAVLSDVIALARQLPHYEPPRAMARGAVAILPIEHIRSAYYLRIPTRDEPGVFAQVANALSSHGISIEAAIQKEPRAAQDLVAIVILTQVVTEADLAAAMAEVQSLPQVQGDIARIRLETLD